MTNRFARLAFGPLLILLLGSVLCSCLFSGKPIYYDNEQVIAERAVSRFHELHNQGNFEAIYALMYKPADNQQLRAQTLRDIEATFETVGKVTNSSLGERKVFASPFPEYTSQVKLVYDTESDKGEWTEFFTWNIKKSREAVLAEYHILPKSKELTSTDRAPSKTAKTSVP